MPIEYVNDIKMTIQLLKQCQIQVSMEEGKGDITYILKVNGNQKYQLPEVIVPEKDWSMAALWLCAGALTSGPIVCPNLNLDSYQYETKIVDILRDFGAKIEVYRQYGA